MRWFTDMASGAKTDRDGLAALMVEVRRGRLYAVLVFRLDRLGRSLSHLAQILAELQAHKVALIAPSQGIDLSTSNPAAVLQFNVLAAVAQFEREIITERVNAGIAAAKQRGVKLGRPQKAWLRADEVKALMGEGHKAAEISRRLGLAYSTASEMVRELKTKTGNVHPV